MNKIFVIRFECNDDGDMTFGIINNNYYENRDEAREAMLKDFDLTKSEFDNTDDLNENHTLDGAFLQANNEWYMTWCVEELNCCKVR